MNTTPLIHVVDDDESMRTALLRLLGAAGFDALGYGSAGEFLLHPVPDRPGCLLLDLRLPGPSGLALQEALQRGGVNLPVVFLTGHADVPSTVRGMKAGAVDFLTKPVQRDILLDALRRALARDAEQRRSRDEAGRLHARFDSLTQREREVFDGIVAGKLNKADRSRAGHRGTHDQEASRASHGQARCRLGGRPRPTGGAAATLFRKFRGRSTAPHRAMAPSGQLRGPLVPTACPLGRIVSVSRSVEDRSHGRSIPG